MRTAALAAALALSWPALAADVTPGPVEAAFVSCYDGDTCRFDALVWPGITIHTAVRLRGVDTPEIAGQCDAEKAAAIAARDFIASRLSGASSIVLTAIEPDKYGGRVIATVLIDGASATDLLIADGHARAYDGGKREGWCEQVAQR